jgi:hypothetical protein
MSRERRSRQAVAVGLGILILIMGVALAEIPKKINYQGRLVDAETGQAMAGAHEMVFRIYEVPEGGTQVWSESASVQVDSAGVFSVMLGEINPLDLPFEGPVWLEVEVGGEVLSPRREMASVPFAFYAESAGHAAGSDSIGGYGAGDFIRLGETSVITAEMIVGGEGSGLDADMLDGLDAGAFADTGHAHDDRYVNRDSLGTVGTLNDGSNPVDWTRLKGVPGDFADGVDDMGGAGDGHSLDAEDGDPVDAVYVDDEGYVGIGTTSPTERLHLTGSTSRILVEAGTSNPEIQLAGLLYPPSEVWRIYLHKGLGALCFARGGDRMTINGVTGNVAIGTGTTGERLHVEGNINLAGDLKMDYLTTLSVEGSSNTMLGQYAGSNTTASNNTFVGTAAGHFNGLGTQNVFVGDSSGFANTQGFYNMFGGHTAGFANTTGQDNTFIGARAGRSNNQGNWNTFVGSGAGASTEDASSNTFLGAGAGASNVSGADNICIGQGAGGSNTSGHDNTCIGNWCGPHGNGSGNVFLGFMAGINESGSDKLYIANGPDDDDALIYGDFSTGRVGLGTLEPAARLHLASPTSNFGMLRLENSNAGSNEASIGFKPGSDATGLDTWVAGVGAWGETDDFVIGKEEPKMVITEDGRVGIGETDPFNAIEVKQSSTCWIRAEAEGGLGVAGLGLQNDTGNWAIDLRGDKGDALTFMYGSAFQFHFLMDTEGNVGLGTQTPEQKLHLKASNPRVLIESTSLGAEVNFKHTGDASSDIWAIYKEGASEDLRFYQGGDKVWIQGGTGNVGIGGSPGTNKLYISGSGCYTGSWGGCSDLRFKRDIEDVTDAIDKVMNLRGVSFLWRSDEHEEKNFDSKRHYGVVAQEVQEVLPEVVVEGAGGEKAVAYTEIVPVLIEAIKAQQREIETLKQRIAGLEAEGETR